MIFFKIIYFLKIMSNKWIVTFKCKTILIIIFFQTVYFTILYEYTVLKIITEYTFVHLLSINWPGQNNLYHLEQDQ